MAIDRRLPLLLVATALLVVMLPISLWRQRRSADARSADERTRVIAVAQRGERAQADLVDLGMLWTGEFFDDVGEWPVEARDLGPKRPRTNSSISGRIEVADADLTAEFEFHECEPGSAECSTGGIISVFSAGQRVCVISLGILRLSAEGLPRSDYRVTWEPRDEGRALTELEKLTLLRRLAGPVEIPDRATLHQQLRVAYDGSPQTASSTAASELAAQAVIRAALAAIVGARDLIPSNR